MSRRTNYHYDAMDGDDDDEDDKITNLRNKVGILKNVSIMIGEETREQNKFLMQQDSVADNLLSRLRLNTSHVAKIARLAPHKFVFYLLGFVLFVMFFIYKFVMK